MAKVKATKIELRRLRVAELLAARPHISVRQIAREIGCSVSTAHGDVQSVRREWATRRLHLYESHAAEDLARTDAAIAAIWPHVTDGRGWAIDRLIALLTYRAKVLGLETQRHEIDVGEILASYLSRVAEAGGASAP